MADFDAFTTRQLSLVVWAYAECFATHETTSETRTVTPLGDWASRELMGHLAAHLVYRAGQLTPFELGMLYSPNNSLTLTSLHPNSSNNANPNSPKKPNRPKILIPLVTLIALVSDYYLGFRATRDPT